ncbi:MAG TPA: NADH-quinone oxidoreductase subunit H [Bryobacteraceae bacterium]|nr:NADH-quinone oxidoreductase subunit H [Bryobacteraceae bacterium]
MNFYILTLLKAAMVAGALLVTLLYIQWVERKVIAHIQVRPGPYRVGPHGLFQPVADAMKLLLKEDLLPPGVNRFFYLLAPFLAITLSLISISVIPFGPTVEIAGVKTNMQIADLSIGVLFILAISSLTVYGIVLAGWASNSKYPLLGGLRASAQMVSYELPLGMAVASTLLLSNTLSLREIVLSQSHFYLGFIPAWNVIRLPFPQVISFVIFIIAVFAETNRIPFDLPEAETELVAGFHTEYSSMKFAGFFMAEYANMITVSALGTTLFLGGWLPLFPERFGSRFIPSAIFLLVAIVAFYHGAQATRRRDSRTFPGVGVFFLLLAGLFLIPTIHSFLLPLFWFLAKTGFLLFCFIWVRGTLPRFRYDQLMRFTWTFLFPVAVANLLITGLLVAIAG